MVATETIRLLQTHRDTSFFIGAGFFRPHPPFVAPKKYFDLYPLDKIVLPQDAAHDRKDIPAMALTINPPNFGLTNRRRRGPFRRITLR